MKTKVPAPGKKQTKVAGGRGRPSKAATSKAPAAAATGPVKPVRSLQEPKMPSTSPVWLWPSLREAARLIHVDAGWLSKRPLARERCGQEQRLAPTLVLELADEYRRCDTGEVGAALVEHGRSRMRSRDELELLERDVERYITTTRSRDRSTTDDDWWLAGAKRRLPDHVFSRIVAITQGGKATHSVEGVRFDDEDDA